MAAHGIPSNRAAASGRHGRQQSSHGVAPPRDLLREGGDQDDQRDDDDRREDLVEDPGRRFAESDGDPDDRECPCNGQDDERVPGPPVRTFGRGGQEAADGAVALAPGEEPGRRPKVRTRGRTGRARAGRRPAWPPRRGPRSGRRRQGPSRVRRCGFRRWSGRDVRRTPWESTWRAAPLVVGGSLFDCARHRGRPHRGRPDRSLRARPERGGRVDAGRRWSLKVVTNRKRRTARPRQPSGEVESACGSELLAIEHQLRPTEEDDHRDRPADRREQRRRLALGDEQRP